MLQELTRLRRALEAFAYRPEWFLSDLSLRGFCLEAVESMTALQLLLPTNHAHRAIPLARLVFEAAQQGLVLATHEDYAHIGVRTWVYYRRRGSSLLCDGDNAATERDLDNRLQSMAAAWGSFYGQAGDEIARARKAVMTNKRRPDNWLGESFIPRHVKAYEICGNATGNTGLTQQWEKTNRDLYTAFSLETHAAPRIDVEEIRIDSSGAITVMEVPRNLDITRKGVTVSCAVSLRELTLALEYRAARAEQSEV